MDAKEQTKQEGGRRGVRGQSGGSMLGKTAPEGSAERGACECAWREETHRWVFVGRGFMTSCPHMS